MDSWTAEPALLQRALDVWGPERLDLWLYAQYQQHSELDGMTLTRAWVDIDGGPLIDRLCQRLSGPVALPAARMRGQTIPFYCIGQRLLFNALLQALPIEQLPESLIEQRLQLDVGL